MIIRKLPYFIYKYFANQSYWKKIISNTSWLFADRILNLVLTAVTGIWIARYLGPEQYGVYSFVIAFAGLFAAFSPLGLDGLIIRDIVHDPEHTAVTLGTTFFLKFVGSIAIVFLTILAIIYIRPDQPEIHWYVAIISFGTVIKAFDVIDLWFQAHIRVRDIVIVKNIVLLFASFARIYFIMAMAPMILFLWVILFEMIGISIALVIVYWQHHNRLRSWSFRLERARALMEISWPLILSSVAVTVYMKIDQVMLGQMLNDQAVGLYSIAVRLSEICYFIPGAVISSLTPSIIELKKIDEQGYYRRLSQIFRLMVGIALAIAIPMTFMAKPIVELLFGEAYGDAGVILAIHIWASLFVFLGVAQSVWDILEEQTSYALIRTVVGAIINIVLNLLLIPSLGGIGTAIATVVSYAFAAVILNVISEKTRRIFWIQMRSFIFLS